MLGDAIASKKISGTWWDLRDVAVVTDHYLGWECCIKVLVGTEIILYYLIAFNQTLGHLQMLIAFNFSSTCCKVICLKLFIIIISHLIILYHLQVLI